VGARSPVERVATERCIRQWTQARAGLEVVPVSRKKNRTVSNHTIFSCSNARTYFLV